MIQPSLFDEHDLAEVVSPDFPEERLIVCRNPLLAAERARKRAELLAATERQLDEIVMATRRAKKPLSGQAKIGLRLGRVLNRHKVGKHFELTIADQSFSYCRNEPRIAAEAHLDGIYVIRTSVKLGGVDVGGDGEGLQRSLQRRACLSQSSRRSTSRSGRSFTGWTIGFVHMCSYACWPTTSSGTCARTRPVLFDDHEREAAEATRASIVEPAPRSDAARAKDKTKQTEDGLPVHSFRTLLADLGTLAKEPRASARRTGSEFYELTQPTTLQQRALDLLGVSL